MGIIAMLIYLGVTSVVNHTYCMILDEDWSGGWNHDVWTREVECGGFGLVMPSIIKGCVR
jgi:hypothetical protein